MPANLEMWQAIGWAVTGAIGARRLGVRQLVLEQYEQQKDSKKKAERKSHDQILWEIIAWRNRYFWLANAGSLVAAIFAVCLLRADDGVMTARLAVYVGAAAPALLGNFFGALVRPNGSSSKRDPLSRPESSRSTPPKKRNSRARKTETVENDPEEDVEDGPSNTPTP
jgi:hypothetical protein